MKKQVGTINIVPTPTGYALSLIRIIEETKNLESYDWAKQEIINAFKVVAKYNPDKWGKEE